jgi:RNA-directed DNA polymerase
MTLADAPRCRTETDDRGRKTRTTGARDNRRGIPQGSPISSLLANLYMRRFVLGWKMLGLERSLGSRIVTYADDATVRSERPGNATFISHLLGIRPARRAALRGSSTVGQEKR